MSNRSASDLQTDAERMLMLYCTCKMFWMETFVFFHNLKEMSDIWAENQTHTLCKSDPIHSLADSDQTCISFLFFF